MREAAWGGGLLLPLIAERLGVSGDGVAAQRAPMLRGRTDQTQLALSDNLLCLSITRRLFAIVTV